MVLLSADMIDTDGYKSHSVAVSWKWCKMCS